VHVTILAIHPFYVVPSGMDAHMRWLADQLVARGHQVSFHIIAHKQPAIETGLMRLQALRDKDKRVHGHPMGWTMVPPPEHFPPLLFKGVVKRALEALEADFVIVPSGDAILGQLCRQAGVRTMVIGCHDAWIHALTDPIFKENLEGLEVAAVSEAVARVAEQELGFAPWLLINGVDEERVVGRLRTYEKRMELPIGMVNCARRKGGGVFADVAASFPTLSFATTGSTASEIPVPMPTNVTDVGHKVAMRAFYGSLQLLVVPSLWFEAWGRVVTEAQLNGIPVIGTDRGGLPEVLSEPAIPVRQWALEPWKDPVITAGVARRFADAIARVREPDAYRDAVVRGFEKAQQTQARAIASVDQLEVVLRGDAPEA